MWKSGGSLTAADLIAAKPGEWLLVQVKSGATPVPHAEFNELFQIAELLSAGGHAGAYGRVHAIIADWPDRSVARWGPMRLRRICGNHIFGKKLWPTEPFSIDVEDE